MPKFSETCKHIIAQNEEIEIFNNDTAQDLTGFIVAESQELLEAINLAFLNDDATEVASELADLFYLLVRLSDMLGIDPCEAVEIKIKRNKAKYLNQPDIKTAKRVWEEKGGDKTWFDELVSK